MTSTAHFDNSYADLGEPWCVPIKATRVAKPSWIAWNKNLATSLNWPNNWQKNELILNALAGNTTLPGSEPVTTVYAGHQFGSYNPRLGDGRALLLGEWVTNQGKRFDIQLKGSGPTPFSRSGDGRSSLGPVIREYLMSEAMHYLGVPTTRALAAIMTGEQVFRSYPESGAILTRVARSHLRIGTVQYFSVSNQTDGLAELVDYATRRLYKDELDVAQEKNPSVFASQVLLTEVCKNLASLVAQWQGLGFIHGVLNTDNMLLSGETIDYGPCAFIDSYAPNKVFSAIDTSGRYAYQNQPSIVHWNLGMLAQCLLPILSTNASKEDEALIRAQTIVDNFNLHFNDHYATILSAKFGLSDIEAKDNSLIKSFFNTLHRDNLDFTLTFRWLTEIAADNLDNTPLPELFTPSNDLIIWLNQWRQARANREGELKTMQKNNPVVIPRNHQIARAITAAESGNYTIMETLFQRWKNPTIWQANDEHFAAVPQPTEEVHRTFCGT